MKAYIVEVRKTAKGPQIVVSRTHPGLIKRLFELEVPEIADGIVEIKACAREPGHRTKIAVWSNDHNVDPVGACVGARGARVRMVVNELRGEKIDIVPFSEDLPDFVAKALSPAKVKEVRIHDDIGVAEVIVPDFQLSLAIGKEGQNARLAARLTGLRVDIKSESQLAEEEAGGGGGYDDDVDYAEGEWVAERRDRASWSGTKPTAPSSVPSSGPRRGPGADRDAGPAPGASRAEADCRGRRDRDRAAAGRRDRRLSTSPVRTCIGCRRRCAGRRTPASRAWIAPMTVGGRSPRNWAVARGSAPIPRHASNEAVRRRAFGRAFRRTIDRAGAVSLPRRRIRGAVGERERIESHRPSGRCISERGKADR